MGALAVLLLLAAGGGIYAATGGARRLDMLAGVTRRIRFENGSTPENESRLRVLFAKVVDEGGGVYSVTPGFDGTVSVPSGSSVVGASGIHAGSAGIVLFAAFLNGRHVGFAFGESSARAIHAAYSPVTFRRSSQAYPQKWAAAWRPVYGDFFKRTVWGRFLSPYDETIASYMKGNGLYARAEPNPSYKTPEEWQRLALQ